MGPRASLEAGGVTGGFLHGSAATAADGGLHGSAAPATDRGTLGPVTHGARPAGMATGSGPGWKRCSRPPLAPGSSCAPRATTALRGWPRARWLRPLGEAAGPWGSRGQTLSWADPGAVAGKRPRPA